MGHAQQAGRAEEGGSVGEFSEEGGQEGVEEGFGDVPVEQLFDCLIGELYEVGYSHHLISQGSVLDVFLLVIQNFRRVCIMQGVIDFDDHLQRFAAEVRIRVCARAFPDVYPVVHLGKDDVSVFLEGCAPPSCDGVDVFLVVASEFFSQPGPFGLFADGHAVDDVTLCNGLSRFSFHACKDRHFW